jgi:hypothetical protein
MAKCSLHSLSCWAHSHNSIISHENKCRSECRPCWTEWNEIPSCLWAFLVDLLGLCCMDTLEVSMFYGDWTLEAWRCFHSKTEPCFPLCSQFVYGDLSRPLGNEMQKGTFVHWNTFSNLHKSPGVLLPVQQWVDSCLPSLQTTFIPTSPTQCYCTA